MNIRPATPEDKPAIIELMKQSLGETMIPKSEGLWNWKHEQNPFGPSYVLLAEEANTLIGIRAFMQWRWRWQGQEFKAIRAVDTATHPAHQGKGIFKKLTLQQLEACKSDGVHFVFNTPNDKSKPGYLKMGWVEQGKMPLKFAVRQPISLAYAKFFNKHRFTSLPIDPTPVQEWKQDVSELVAAHKMDDKHLTTITSPAYIQWRYATNPLFRYNYFTDHKTFLLISRIKNHSFTKELRLVDFIVLDPNANKKTINRSIHKMVKDFCRQHHVNLISLSGKQYGMYATYFSWMGLLPVKPLGPIITLKDVNMNDRFPQLMNVDNWSYSLGDMELF